MSVVISYLRNQDLVAGLYADCNALALLVKGTGANGEDLGLVQLLDGGLGEEDAGCGLGFGLDALDEDAVEERGDGADRLDGRLWNGRVSLELWVVHAELAEVWRGEGSGGGNMAELTILKECVA